MKHTEQKIVEIARNIMHAIDWNYDRNKKLSAGFHSLEEQIKDLDKLRDSGYLPIDYDVAKATLKPYWTVCFDFEPEAEVGKNFMFLDIDDTNGEPMNISHKQFSGKIKKDSDGNYIVQK
ncbi:hypothetical protein ACM39_02495 [Chryseobacterium sp. FH2]|uniref:hypothetical protein n=1 Tax=Chryseobacterium sp. FH2 TaxID=1674291 RepID=UPI00065AEF50|nr:hypothetical protein [Chryseobacterium sp. FH2]KMQ69929.1 hypothetical protein ACM39_02495 [Chryseobacterium sp. FH2]